MVASVYMTTPKARHVRHFYRLTFGLGAGRGGV
jgi:hypothetical protein